MIRFWKGLASQSLTVKVVFTISTVVFFIVGIGTFWLVHVTEKGIAEISVTTALYQTQLMKSKLVETMISNSARHEELEKLLLKDKSTANLDEVNIFNPSGIVRFSSFPGNIGKKTDLAAGPKDRMTIDDARIDFSGKGRKNTLRIIHSVRGGTRCLVCHQSAKGDFLGGIELYVPLSPIYKRFMASRFFFVFVAFAIILSSAFLIRWLVRGLVKQPIQKLVTTMEKAGGGMLPVRVRVNEDPDLRQLANAFNTMVERIESSQKKIEEHYQKELAQSNRLASLGQFISNVSHEIKNPLAAISSSLHALRSEFKSIDGEELFRELTLQISRIEQTVSNLLRFVRQAPPRFEKCMISGPIHEALHLANHWFLKNGIQIQWHHHAETAAVWVDAGQIQQVFLNLFLNAAHAMPRGGTLTIRIFSGKDEALRNVQEIPSDQGIFVEVEDTGHGISSQNLPKIFDPFFTTKQGGTGLGLSVVKGILESHKAIIRVKSQAGKGTTMTVLFPVLCNLRDIGAILHKEETLLL